MVPLLAESRLAHDRQRIRGGDGGLVARLFRYRRTPAKASFRWWARVLGLNQKSLIRAIGLFESESYSDVLIERSPNVEATRQHRFRGRDILIKRRLWIGRVEAVVD